MDTKTYKIVFYKTGRGECPVSEFLDSLRDIAQGKMAKWFDQLAIHGPDLHRPMADVVSGQIRELRMSFGKEEYRLLYFIYDKFIVVTTGFRKKTRQIPHREISKAFDRMHDWIYRYQTQGKL